MAILLFDDRKKKRSSLLSNLVSYWKLDEFSAGVGPVTRNDSVGTNHLSDTNTTESVAGLINNAANFQVINAEFLSITDNPSLSVADIDFSFSFWIKLTTGGIVRGVIGKGTSVGAANTFQYTVQMTAGNAAQWIVSSGAATANVSSGALVVGVWANVVCWHDSVNNEIGISLNAGIPNTTPWANGSYDGAGSFYLAARPGGVGPLDAALDEVGFWKNKVLSSSERTALYNGGLGVSYPF